MRSWIYNQSASHRSMFSFQPLVIGEFSIRGARNLQAPPGMARVGYISKCLFGRHINIVCRGLLAPSIVNAVAILSFLRENISCAILSTMSPVSFQRGVGGESLLGFWHRMLVDIVKLNLGLLSRWSVESPFLKKDLHQNETFLPIFCKKLSCFNEIFRKL